jgi:hypothetical protein
VSGSMPECMAPDGAEPCVAYTSLLAEVRALRSLLAAPHGPQLQEVLDNIIESGLLSEEQYDVLAAGLKRPLFAFEIESSQKRCCVKLIGHSGPCFMPEIIGYQPRKGGPGTPPGPE